MGPHLGAEVGEEVRDPMRGCCYSPTTEKKTCPS